MIQPNTTDHTITHTNHSSLYLTQSHQLTWSSPIPQITHNKQSSLSLTQSHQFTWSSPIPQITQSHKTTTHHSRSINLTSLTWSTTMTTEQVYSSIACPPPWPQNRSTVLQSVHHHDYRKGSNCIAGPAPWLQNRSSSIAWLPWLQKFHGSTVCPPPWLQNISTVLQSAHHHDYRTFPQFFSLSTTMTTEQFHS
jgi:hypothetical protein